LRVHRDGGAWLNTGTAQHQARSRGGERVRPAVGVEVTIQGVADAADLVDVQLIRLASASDDRIAARLRDSLGLTQASSW
jgi:hypothetical protein